MFHEIYDSLLNTNCSDRADTYFILADFKSYAEAQKKVEAAYRDSEGWAKMALLNTASAGKFSSDRTIQQYVDEIGDLKIYWDREENLVYMTGPAAVVFDGEIEL